MSLDGYLGIDIGGTSVTADLVDRDGRLLASRRWASGSGGALLEDLRGMIASAADDAALSGVRIRGVGALSPGHVDADEGVVRFASNLGWTDVPLARILGGAPGVEGVPLRVGHDVRWAGIAEGTFGAARGAEDFAVLSIGTGIAACLVAGGQVITGAAGSAGEIGHATAVPGGDLCACGRVGCLDAYASGAGLLRRYAARTGGAELSGVDDLVGRLDRDPDARRVWEEAVDALAVGLCTLTMTADPALISLVGGVARAEDRLLRPLRARLGEELGWKSAPDVVVSPLRALPGRAGAVLLAMAAAGDDSRAERWSPDVVAAWGNDAPAHERTSAGAVR